MIWRVQVQEQEFPVGFRNFEGLREPARVEEGVHGAVLLFEDCQERPLVILGNHGLLLMLRRVVNGDVLVSSVAYLHQIHAVIHRP